VRYRRVALTTRGGDLTVGAMRGEQGERLARLAGLSQRFGCRFVCAVEVTTQQVIARPEGATFRATEGAVGPEGPAIVRVQPGACGREVSGVEGQRGSQALHREGVEENHVARFGRRPVRQSLAYQRPRQREIALILRQSGEKAGGERSPLGAVSGGAHGQGDLSCDGPLAFQ